MARPRGPSLPRPPHKEMMRLAVRLSRDDLISGGLSLEGECIHLNNGTKNKNSFDIVFPPDCCQSEMNTSILPDLLNGLMNGMHSSLVSFGGMAQNKNTTLYSSLSDQQGLFQSAFHSLFNLLNKNEKNGLTVKISALHFSQRSNVLTDLLSQFNTEPRRFPVKIVDDIVEGPRVENGSELRVDSVDQAMFYLNTVIDRRLIEGEEIHRSCHLFISISLCGQRRTTLHLIDLGMGERNSQRGSLSMPSIGNILISLCQGQKNLPSRDHPLSQLLRIGMGRARQTTILCSFAERIDDNENILQLATKLSKARRNPRRVKGINDSTSISSSERKKKNELESSSEQSAAETVIFIGPVTGGRRSFDHRPHPSPSRLLNSPDSPLRPLQLHMGSNGISHRSPSRSSFSNTSPINTPPTSSVPPLLKGYTPFFAPYSRVYEDLCSPPGTSKGIYEDDEDEREAIGGISFRERTDFGVTVVRESEEKKKIIDRQVMEEEKKEFILKWMEESGREGIGEKDEEEEEFLEREREMRIPRPLEDIQELDEDSLRESIRSSKQSITILNGKHPLSILSREALEVIELHEDSALHDQENDDDLERAMAASVSSMVSHDLLSRVKDELEESNTVQESRTCSLEEPSEMGLYRRASHLEEYATERLREIEEAERKKKKRLLNCCQSMISSGSTDKVERVLYEDEKKERKAELKKRREEIEEEREELKRKSDEIKRQLDVSLLQQFTTFTLKAAGLKPKSSHVHPSGTDSMPTTPTVSSRKTIIPVRTPSLSNCTSPAHKATLNGKSSLPVRREGRRGSSKTRSSKEREDSIPHSQSSVTIRSPYSKVTPVKTSSGAESSGRGSDDNGSSLVGTGSRSKKRESYSASSGYESASGDYRYYTRMGDGKHDRLRIMDKRCGIAAKEADRLRERQRKLQQELAEAKARIGEGVEDWRAGLEGKSALSHTTLLDTLLQENRILEKRLVACQNHAMIVTSLL